jgi:hypothetical protein
MRSGKLSLSLGMWRQRLPFLALNIALAALLFAGVVTPVVRYFTDGEESLAERRATLARYEAVAAQEGAVSDYVRQVKVINTHGDLLEGTTAGVVAAALQARLKVMAESSGVTVRSIQALPPKPLNALGLESADPTTGGSAAASNDPAHGAGPQLVGARVEVAGSPEAIHNFTRAIWAGPPLLLTTTASISQTMMLWRPTGDEQPPEVTAQFEVYGGALAKDQP